MDDESAKGNSSPATLRVVRAIEFLAKNRGGRIEDVAVALGVHKSNASRLLAALRDVGWVTANDTRTWYTLGPRLAAVGQSAGGQGVMEFATNIAAEVRDETGESVHLSIPDLPTQSMIVTACFDSPYVLRVSQPVGARDSLHSTAVGKIFLASLDDRELDEIVPALGGPAGLRGEIAHIRDVGYAINDQESRSGVIAGAILLTPQEREDHPPIALSVAAPTTRWTVDDAEQAMRALVDRYGVRVARQRTRP